MVCQLWGIVSLVLETLQMVHYGLGVLVPHWRPGTSPDGTKDTGYLSALHFEVVGH